MRKQIPRLESPMTAYLVRIVDLMISFFFQDADCCIPSCCPQKGFGMEGKRLDVFGNRGDKVTCPEWTH